MRCTPLRLPEARRLPEFRRRPGLRAALGWIAFCQFRCAGRELKKNIHLFCERLLTRMELCAIMIMSTGDGRSDGRGDVHPNRTGNVRMG